MSGTHVFYNGILFRDCETLEYVESIEYDESGTDPLYTRIRLTVASMLVSLPGRYVDIPGDDPDFTSTQKDHPGTIKIPLDVHEAAETRDVIPDRKRILEGRLQEPRKDFWMAINGVTNESQNTHPTDNDDDHDPYRILLAATGEYSLDDTNGSTGQPPEFIRDYYDTTTPVYTDLPRKDNIDANNGPFPKDVSIRIIGSRAMRVQVTFEICKCICRGLPSGSTPPARDARKVKGVISNRWSVVENLDGKFATAFNIEGTLVVSDHRYKPMAMRTMVHPLLFPYAKLESREFSVDRTGLKLGYRFTIKEEGNAPPVGIVDWDGTYTEQTGMGSGRQIGIIDARVIGTIKRPPGMSSQKQKLIMYRLLFAIMKSRITGVNALWNPLPGQNPATCIVKDAAVVESSLKAGTSMSLRATVEYAGQNLDEFNMRLENMGKPLSIPGYDPKWWPVPDFYQWDTESENAQTDLNGAAGGYGTFLDSYFQEPCKKWHSMPRGTTTDKLPLVGVDPDNDEDATSPDNGTFSTAFTPYQVEDLAGNLSDVDTLPPVPVERFGINADVQLSGFSYIHWESDVRYEGDSGIVALPLSKPRVDPDAPSLSGPSGANPRKKWQTTVFARLHAPIQYRTFKVIASRIGAWPKIPVPQASFYDGNNIRNVLMSATSVKDSPKLLVDNTTMSYSVQCEWRYGLSRPVGYDKEQSTIGDVSTEKFYVGSSPIDRTTPSTNALPYAILVDSEGQIDGPPLPPPPSP